MLLAFYVFMIPYSICRLDSTHWLTLNYKKPVAVNTSVRQRQLLTRQGHQKQVQVPDIP